MVNLISKIGEKITIGRSKTINNSSCKNFIYNHSIVNENLSKLSVVVSLKCDEVSESINTFGKQLSMHIAASNPIALTSDQISKDILEKEKELIEEELKTSGKPKEIVNKISIGKLNKFKEENSLLTQQWVMDPKKKVKEIMHELNVSTLEVKEYYRIKIGE